MFRGFFETTGTKDEVGWPFTGSHPDKIRKAKHVESISAACLDEGSTPSSSTNRRRNQLFTTVYNQRNAQITQLALTAIIKNLEPEGAFLAGVFTDIKNCP